MHNNQVEIILSKEKISEIIKAYNVLGDFLGTVLPRELLYKKTFQQGLESALKEVELGKSQRVHSFDEFTK